MIQAVLNVGKTWYNETLDGYWIAKLYGKGGIHEHCDVVGEIANIRTPPNGRKALLNFLCDWEKRNI